MCFDFWELFFKYLPKTLFTIHFRRLRGQVNQNLFSLFPKIISIIYFHYLELVKNRNVDQPTPLFQTKTQKKQQFHLFTSKTIHLFFVDFCHFFVNFCQFLSIFVIFLSIFVNFCQFLSTIHLFLSIFPIIRM